MGCCGKRKKNYDEHKKMLTRPTSSRSAVVAASVPRGVAVKELSLTRSGGRNRTIYVEKSGGTCPLCGSRTIIKRQYSERLRRYFNVSWCSTCKDTVA
jgi:hypothetical protein